MSATIERPGEWSATITGARWRAEAPDPILGQLIEDALNAEFGADWRARFGEYVPSRENAAAEAAAEAFGGLVTEPAPAETLPENAIP